jgi:hypothetical protein
MLTPLKTEVLQVEDLSHEARRFRTIVWSFQRNLELLFKDTGLSANVDATALASAFSNWRQAFDKSKYLADVNRHDSVILKLPGSVDHRLARWPEGYAYTSFCLSVAAAILKELGDEEPEAARIADDPKFWDSFRENALEDPNTAIGFFDLVCGQEPNWMAPAVPWLRKALGHQDDQKIGNTEQPIRISDF